MRLFINPSQVWIFYHFNPRTREGCDDTIPQSTHPRTEFQSTHPRGVRRKFFYIISHICSISIHAPARGAPALVAFYFLNRSISIHAPARGATFRLIKRVQTGEISIHAPARGATYTLTAITFLRAISIHAPARGATLFYSFTCRFY